jgi:hypothetical protein
MTLEQAIEQARKGIKVTHKFFIDDEYMIIKGNTIIFENGEQVFISKWVKGKKYLNDGWSIYNLTKNNKIMRDNGYYWIKLNNNKHISMTENGWEVAYFENNYGWYSIWEGGCYQDNEIDEINENRIKK